MFAMDKAGIALYGFEKFCDDVHVGKMTLYGTLSVLFSVQFRMLSSVYQNKTNIFTEVINLLK